MRAVADTLVDQFADLCIIHLAGSDGRIEQVAGSIRPSPGGGVEAISRDLFGMYAALQRVMANSRSELTYVGPDGASATVSTTSSARSLQELGHVVVGHRADPGARPADGHDRQRPPDHGAAATGRPTRGSSTSSPTAAPSPSSGRCCTRETRQAAIAAERRAEQLSRLIEAAISLNPSSSPSDLLAHARRPSHPRAAGAAGARVARRRRRLRSRDRRPTRPRASAPEVRSSTPRATRWATCR